MVSCPTRHISETTFPANILTTEKYPSTFSTNHSADINKIKPKQLCNVTIKYVKTI